MPPAKSKVQEDRGPKPRQSKNRSSASPAQLSSDGHPFLAAQPCQAAPCLSEPQTELTFINTPQVLCRKGPVITKRKQKAIKRLGLVAYNSSYLGG